MARTKKSDSKSRSTNKKVAAKKSALSKKTAEKKVDGNSFSLDKFFSRISLSSIRNPKFLKYKEIVVKRTNDRRFMSALLILVGVLALAYIGYKYLIVGWVDNTPITRIEMYKNLEERYGKDMREQIITERLILNEAQNKGIIISNEEIDSEIKKVETQQGGADKLDQILQLQNISRSELTRQIKLQIIITKLFGDNVLITDQKVDEYIKSNQNQLGLLNQDGTTTTGDNSEASVSAQQRQELKDQLKQQEISQKFSDWLKDAVNGSRVKRS